MDTDAVTSASSGDFIRSLLPWRAFRSGSPLASRALLVAVWTANIVLVVITIAGFFVSDAGYDWLIFVEAGSRVMEGGLYRWDEHDGWRYSPLLAYAFTVLAPIGLLGWTALHLAALAALRDRSLAIITVLSWPFWADVYNGNTMTFVFVAAVGALRSSAFATGSYLLLCLLMPRPLMLPLLVWILWKQAGWRGPFAGMVLLNGILVAATGYGPAWIEALLGVGDAVAATSRDVGPGNLIGPWWGPVGALLAVILLWRGRVGWASLAATPYWLPQYLLMLLLELVSPVAPARHSGSKTAKTVSDGGIS